MAEAGGPTWECVGTTVSTLTATNPSWASATITAVGAAVYDTANSNALLVYVDFAGGSVSSTNGTFQVTTFALNEGILAVC